LGDGHPLVDYRLFTYEGEVRFVQVLHDVNRLERASALRRYYTRDWEPLEVRHVLELGPVLACPATYQAMLRVAKKVATPFDFARVDLYDIRGELYLGEVTSYPGGGLVPFDPPDFDLEMGEPWRLPRLDRHGQSRK